MRYSRLVIDYYFEDGKWAPYKVEYIGKIADGKIKIGSTEYYNNEGIPIDKGIKIEHPDFQDLQLTPEEEGVLNRALRDCGYIELRKPFRFRVILDETMAARGGDIEHSCLGHVGERSGTIWLGEWLFRDLLRENNDELRDRIFRHEREHLLGNHNVDNEDGYRKLFDDLAKRCSDIDIAKRDKLLDRFIPERCIGSLTLIQDDDYKLYYKDRTITDGIPLSTAIENSLVPSGQLVNVLLPFDTPGRGIAGESIRAFASNRLQSKHGVVLLPIDMKKIRSIDYLIYDAEGKISSLSGGRGGPSSYGIKRLLRSGGLILVLENFDSMPVEPEKIVNIYNYLKRMAEDGANLIIVSGEKYFREKIGTNARGTVLEIAPLKIEDVKERLVEADSERGPKLAETIERPEFKDMWNDPFLRNILIQVLYDDVAKKQIKDFTLFTVLERFIQFWCEGYEFKTPEQTMSGYGSAFRNREEFGKFFIGLAYELWLLKEAGETNPWVSSKGFNIIYGGTLNHSVPESERDCYSEEFENHPFITLAGTKRAPLYSFSHSGILYYFLRKFAIDKGLDTSGDLDEVLRRYRGAEKEEKQKVYTWAVPSEFMHLPYPEPESVFNLNNLLKIGLVRPGAVFKLTIPPGEGGSEKFVKATLTEDGRLEVRGKLFSSFSQTIESILAAIGDEINPIVLALQNRPVEELWSYDGEPISHLRYKFYSCLYPKHIKDVFPKQGVPGYQGLGIDKETSDNLGLFDIKGEPNLSKPFNPGKPFNNWDETDYVSLDYKGILGFFRRYSVVGDGNYIAWQMARPLKAEEILRRENTIERLIAIGSDKKLLKIFNDCFTNPTTQHEKNRKLYFYDMFFYGDRSNSDFNAPTLDYNRFFEGVISLKDLLDNLSTPETEWERLAREMDEFINSKAYDDLFNFVQKCKNYNPSNNWDSWQGLVEKYREDIYKLWLIIQEISFYNGAAGIQETVSYDKGGRIISMKYSAHRARWNPEFRDIIIEGGRSPRLLKKKEWDKDKVVPSGVHLNNGSHNLIITGANGAGKTQFIKMMATNIFLAHRGLFPYCEYMELPYLEYMAVSVDSSRHGTSASSYQNEVRRVNNIIKDFEESGARNGIIFLDEPFKGTDSKDAIPLIIGLLKYFEKRGVYVVISTHFAELKDYLSSMEEPPNCGFVKFEGKDFELKEGFGKSYGIRTARQFGLPSEIIETAQGVIDGNPKYMDEEIRDIPDSDVYLRVSSMADMCDLALAPSWDMEEKGLCIGEALEIFRKNCVLSNGDRDFSRIIFHSPKPEERKRRNKDIGRMLQNSEYRNALRDIIKKYFFYFHTIFNCDELTPGSDPEPPYRRFMEAVKNTFSMGEYLNGLNLLLNELGKFSSSLQDSIYNELTSNLHSIVNGDTLSKLGKFVEGNTSGQEFGFDEIEKWKGWRRLLNSHEKEIRKLEEILIQLNFYLTAAETINQYKMAGLGELSRGGGTDIKKAWSPLLVGAGKKVVPSDIRLDPNNPITVVTGANGGGKTHYLLEIAANIFLGEQLGNIPAESGDSQRILFLGGTINASEGTDSLSSFETEVERIAEVVKNCERLGFPPGGVVIFDEPFRGTCSSDACPLIMGLLYYLQRRGIQVVITTHFSELFRYFEQYKLLNWRGLYFDNLSEESTPFVPYAGQGKSDGIEVFKRMGGAKEIWELAKEIQGVVAGGIKKRPEEKPEKVKPVLNLGSLWATPEEFVLNEIPLRFDDIQKHIREMVRIKLKTGEIIEGVLTFVSNPFCPVIFIEGQPYGIFLSNVESIKLVENNEVDLLTSA